MDFDKIIPRKGTDSLKFDGGLRRGKPVDILPLWVADMDFPAPECVLEAVHERVSHGIFGYSEPDTSYFDALAGWFTRRLGYEFSPDWVTLTPGVVYAIAIAIKAFTMPGEAVLIQEPVYYPFRETVTANGRRLVVNELKLPDGADTYIIDFEDFERKIIENGVKLFLLCSPHNPVSRVWAADELREIVRVCQKHNVLIFSDEIHCDFIFPAHEFHVLPALCPNAQESIILCNAPSKTFNLAGLQLANVFIADKNLRKTYRREVLKSGFSQAGSLAIVACRAAYAHGENWLNALNKYLHANMLYLDEFLKANLPYVKLIPPQATYLAWLDCRALSLSPDDLDRKITYDAKLWLSRGDSFGTGGEGFTRINVGCPRATLAECLERLRVISLPHGLVK
ncbi:MAG: pyridoxal phosphate-dependent aminotransferase [Defluviitaleaceae bacterium]|nr:pyridoxal phosphate-dependent aminotransferase [Defluviitaleaceae bacterium]